MTMLSARWRSRIFLNLVVVVSACFLTACLKHGPNQPSTHVERLAAAQTRTKKLEIENEKLRQTLAHHDRSMRALEEEIETLHLSLEEKEAQTEESVATLQLRLLEKEAQLKQLNERHILQQEMLDDAVLEVVRARAKLRSLESKAKAASNMAEAEIALKALKVQSMEPQQEPELIKAEQLLKMSALEFKQENYAGALFLVSQAKRHIKLNRTRFGGRESIVPLEGEVLFAHPLQLQVLRMSNLRVCPNPKCKVLTTLDKGAQVIGYSYKGQWVRVNSGDGTYGWIYENLVGVP